MSYLTTILTRAIQVSIFSTILTMLLHRLFYVVIIISFVSCTNVVSIKNQKAGELRATKQLLATSAKKFYLDSVTAPRLSYMQLITDSLGKRTLSLLNSYNNSIYFYDYDSEDYLYKKSFHREGPDAILQIGAYLLQPANTYYIYNMGLVEMVAIDSIGHIKEHIALHGQEKEWPLYVPQYIPNASIPMMEIDNHVVMVGMSGRSLTEQNIDRFKFTIVVDKTTNTIAFYHPFPEELYAPGINWEGGVGTQPFYTVSPSGEMVFSFPISHDLYLSPYNSDTYTKIYGGSNTAGTISSIDWNNIKNTPDELIFSHFLGSDTYASIHYDPYREVYYRIMLKALPHSTTQSQMNDKPIVVILMDKDFRYLGETTIGTGREWNYANSFVTKEGLNIEYIDKNDPEEYFLNFKIFTLTDIN